MHKNFQALVLSYKSAPVAIRERFALSETQSRNLLTDLKENLALQDLLILSTCNRTEIYFTSLEDITPHIFSLIATLKGLPNIEEVAKWFTPIQNHDEAVKHLFDVSIGLESQVVGDFQIINQVKQAYQLTADANAAGPFLHRLLHTIFFANKKVTTEIRKQIRSRDPASVQPGLR
jgi:glutamyl-tRNA reductase